MAKKELERGVWMMVKRYRVRLVEEEHQGLKSLVSKGRVAAYRQAHARILLLCDENQVGGAMETLTGFASARGQPRGDCVQLLGQGVSIN